jgi:hypothetical protein
MTFEEFMSKLLKPTYVWRMASGVVGFQGRLDHADQRPLVRSARTRMANARRAIDDLVLERSLTIQDERRCAAVQEIDNPKGPLVLARCEYPREHGPVRGRRQVGGSGLVMHDKEWDHAAPSKGVWWMEPEEVRA